MTGYCNQCGEQVCNCDNQCEDLRAQIARLRELLTRIVEYPNRGGWTIHEMRIALSETADNDKWLADVKANHTVEVLRSLSVSSDPNFIWELIEKYSNQAKKG